MRELGKLTLTIGLTESPFANREFYAQIDDEKRDLHGLGEASNQLEAVIRACYGFSRAREQAGMPSQFPRDKFDLVDLFGLMNFMQKAGLEEKALVERNP